MLWYLVICALMLYPYAIARAGDLSGRKTKHIALMTAIVILWFFMAFRGLKVGVDTKHYAYVFTQFDDIPFSKVFTAVTYANESESWAFDFEPGYRLANKVLSLFFSNAQAITVFNSTVILVLWYHLIQRDSPNFMLSVWLFITLGVYQTEMNVTRNAIAILMVYNAFPYLRRRELPKFLAVCLFASLFHIAALILLPVYFLVWGVKLTPKRVAMLVLGFCVVGVIFPFISPFISSLVPARFAKYLQGNNEKLGSLIVGVLNGGFFLLTLWMIPKRNRSKVFTRERLGVMLVTINLCFFGLNIGLGDASRMAALFGPYLVILIPRMLTLIENRARRREAATLIVLLSGIQYVLRLCINNIGGTLPYTFCW